MFRKISQVLDPLGYHGAAKKTPFFEGWYFKCVSRDGGEQLAIIPGVHLHEQAEERHAFIQVLQGGSNATHYIRYPLTAFKAATRGLSFSLSGNHFSLNHLHLDINEPGLRLCGELHFSGLQPWPVTVCSPGAMGWYAWAPFMQCYHGVGSLDHLLSGRLSLNDRLLDFAGGRGYLEKDWGSSFPSAYLWMQSNHFGIPATGLMISVAVIPWLGGKSFAGFIAGFLLNGRLFRLATYTGANLRALQVEDHVVYLHIESRRHRLQVTAHRATGGWLQAPGTSGMGARIAETLQGRLDVRFFEKRSSQELLLFNGAGLHAGLDAAGDLTQLCEAGDD